VQQGNGDDEGAVEPVGHIDVGGLAVPMVPKKTIA
jgi:hypothetical protein